jgi:hypothetical protein
MIPILFRQRARGIYEHSRVVIGTSIALAIRCVLDSHISNQFYVSYIVFLSLTGNMHVNITNTKRQSTVTPAFRPVKHPTTKYPPQIYPSKLITTTSQLSQTALNIHNTMAATKEYALLCLENPLLGR